MSEKHLKTGEALPPLAKDTLRIYSMRYCPYAQRTRLVLAHKQIPFETVNVNLKDKPEWFFDKNPLGVVPVLEINNEIVYESAICDEYLDEKYGNTKLLPADPYQKARAKILMDGFSKVVSGYYTILGQPEDKEAGKESILKGLDKYEKAFTGKFFGGDSPNMVDVHFWPYFERFPAIEQLREIDLLTQDRFPKLLQWVEDMLSTPMVKGLYLCPEKHTRFFEQYISGDPEAFDQE